MITISGMTMIGLAAKAVIKQMGSYNKYNSRNQEPGFVCNYKFLHNKE